MPFKLGVLGIDHGHIFGMLGQMTLRGCTCDAYWTKGAAVTEEKFRRVFPDLKKVSDQRDILDDPDIKMVLISAIPADRAALAIEAMEAGKDVMVDKPGCTTQSQLDVIRETQARTGRIWTVNFSERFEVPAVTKAEELVFGGAIGRVIQTIGIGPHKQNLATRPEWFFEPEKFGGILCDIGSHQIDQFLHFTGSKEATISHALVENTTMPERPGFQDFGEIVLQADGGHGYIRVDWFTPNGLPTWGDGRLFIQGTEGHIELRKYTDIGRPHTTNTLFLVNGTSNELIPCDDAGLPYFNRLIQDVEDRSETAVSQAHTFTTMRLAIEAQTSANAQ
ncbi:MAG: Gfo/Idh/MocA family oxidoreductase [Boseongicola sp.]|nr:Gfo/Idh/MocA family oxidoreductase [Boseongicola sp.]